LLFNSIFHRLSLVESRADQNCCSSGVRQRPRLAQDRNQASRPNQQGLSKALGKQGLRRTEKGLVGCRRRSTIESCCREAWPTVRFRLFDWDLYEARQTKTGEMETWMEAS